ncbi:MAG: hypothetical protein IJW82_04825 [Clostridia bacterium]|nr:hypothetical protein [Clostridia bacterium]
MFFNKFKKEKNTQPKELKIYVFSEESVLFIKKYAIPQLKINGLINNENIYDILDYADECELNLIDPLSKNGQDKTYDYPEKERDFLGDKFVSEFSGLDIETFQIDYEDLNKRIQLK